MQGCRLEGVEGGCDVPCCGAGSGLALSAVPARFDHAIMNLPASAVDFLDAFGMLDHVHWPGPMPWVHVYTFSKGDETEQGTLATCMNVVKVLRVSLMEGVSTSAS